MMMGEILASAAESIIYIFFLNAFCGNKRSGWPQKLGGFIAAGLLFGNIWAADQMTDYHWATTIVDCLVIFIYSFFFLEGSLIGWFAGAVIYNLGLAGSVACCMNISSLIFSDGVGAWLQAGTSERNFLLTVNKIILVGYIYVVIRIKKRFWNAADFKTRAGVLFLPIFALVMFCLTLQQVLHNYKAEANTGIYVIFLGGIFTFTVVIVILFIRDLAAEKKMRETKLLLKLYEMQRSSLKNEIRHYERIRKIQHDIKNQLLGIRYFLKNGELEKASDYVDELLNDLLFGKNEEQVNLSEYTMPQTAESFSGSLWESLIEMKLLEADRKGIMTDKKIMAVSSLDIDPVDLCTILGNLLDNAIEAEERNDSRRELSIEIQGYTSFFCIFVKNWVDEGRRNEVQKLISYKEDSELHGIGLHNVRDAVGKYKGKFEMGIEDGYFCTKIILITTKV